MKFNTIINRQNIDYYIIKVNETILLIKPGLDGSVLGYNNKYLNLGKFINEKYGYTIICSSNPYEYANNQILYAMELIKEYIAHMNYKDYNILYFGNSNGGVIGAIEGYKFPQIKKMLLNNPPLMINFHKLKDGIEKFNGEKVVFTYGSLDQSIKFIELLNLIENDNLSYYIIEGENHNFSKNICSLDKLIETYLLQ